MLELFLFGVPITVIGGLWWLKRSMDSVSDEEVEEYLAEKRAEASQRNRQSAAQKQKTPTRDHQPPAPRSTPIQVWGRLPVHVEVEGEFARPRSFLKLLGSDPDFETYDGAERQVMLDLVPDEQNPYDRNAVAVWCEHNHVGYLPKDLARSYQKAIVALGASVRVPGRIWARLDSDTVRARAYFNVVHPSGFRQHGTAPGDADVVLPEGARMQVIGEENFMGTLGALVPDEGEAMAWLRLKIDYDFRPNSAKRRINVYLDKDQIGWLSDVQSANMLPLVEYVNERGKVAVAKGVIGGSPLKAEVVLYVARAADVTRDWLDSHSEPTTAQSAQRREFEWDDDE